MRTIALLLLVALLAGCGFNLPAPAPLPTPTPDSVAAFRVAYAALDADFVRLKAQLDNAQYADPDWRAETVRIAERWRADTAAIRAIPQPSGAQWAQAWPLLLEAMDELDYIAGATENAARQQQPALLLPTTERMANALNLLTEALRLVGGDW